ncbi:MAG: MFS transporter [Anaerolineales bacterium]|nr:MFS transporter [Anaerolineales bacterium]
MRHKLTLGLAFSGFIIYAMPNSMLGIAWPSMRQTFGQPLDALGILLLVLMAGHLVSSVANGRFLAQFDYGPVLLASWLLLLVGLLGYVFAPGWGWLLAAAAVGGFGGGMLDAGINTYIANQHGAREMNWLHASYGLGATAGPLVMTTFITNGLAWTRGYLAMAALHGVVVLLMALTLRDWQSAPLPAGERRPRVPYRETLRRPIVWLGLLVFFLYVGIETGIGQWSYTLLTESRQVAADVAGSWISLYWGSLTVGRVLIGLIVRYLGSARTLQLSLLGMLLGTLLLALPPTSLPGLMLTGVSAAAVFPLLTADTGRRTGMAHAANAVGFQFGASSLGYTLIPGLAGWLADGFGLELIAPFFVVMALLMGGAYVLLQGVQQRRAVVV